MPTYEYACRQCGDHLEVVQKFTDDALTVCPSCSGSLRKVFGNIGISFKGSGFYKNDSRSSDNDSKKKEPAAAEGGSSGSGDTPKADAKADGAPKAEPKSDGAKKDGPKGDKAGKGSSTAAAS